MDTLQSWFGFFHALTSLWLRPAELLIIPRTSTMMFICSRTFCPRCWSPSICTRLSACTSSNGIRPQHTELKVGEFGTSSRYLARWSSTATGSVRPAGPVTVCVNGQPNGSCSHGGIRRPSRLGQLSGGCSGLPEKWLWEAHDGGSRSTPKGTEMPED